MITVNQDTCIKCGACEGVCPTDAIEVKNTVVYCDVCQQEPKCAAVCPNGALTVGDIIISDDADPQVRLNFNPSKCDQCGDCVKACPQSTIKLGNEEGELPLGGYCVMCQQCVEICPVDAIGIPGIKEPATRELNIEGAVFIQDCVGCGTCVDECPVNAITLPAYGEPITIDEDTCIKCGICSQTCPWNAVFISENIPEKRAKTIKSFTLATEDCIGCNTCVDACPGDFIKAKGANLSIALPTACAACGLCEKLCPVDAIELDVEWGPAVQAASEGLVNDPEKCIFDGSCALKCPTEAIRVVTKRGMELPSKQKDMGEPSFAMCARCGACAAVCDNDALKLVEVEKVLADGMTVKRNRINFNPSKCDQCGDCIEACPYDMIHETEKPNLPIAGFCTLCENCIERCKEHALSLK
jgi:ferredoxin